MNFKRLFGFLLISSSLLLASNGFSQSSNNSEITASGENDNVDFSSPNGYTDKEFTEISKAYIQPQGLNLDSIKSLPLSQMSDDFINKIINSIKTDDIDSKQKQEIIDYLLKLLQVRGTKGYKQDTSKIILDEKASSDTDYTQTSHKYKNQHSKYPITIVRRDTNKIISQPSSLPKPRFDVNLGGISTIRFANNSNFINVNGLSVEPVSVNVWYKAPVRFLDVSFFAKNVSSGIIYLIRRYARVPVKGSGNKIVQFTWAKPQISFGKYKIIIAIRYLNTRGTIVNSVEKYWGNTLNTDYLVFKN